MFLFETLLKELETTDCPMSTTEEGLMSFLAFVAQPGLNMDIETTSKLMNRLMSDLFGDQQFLYYAKFLQSVDKENAIMQGDLIINVREPFNFKVILFNSLKYNKQLFRHDYCEPSRSFLQSIVRHMLQSVSIKKYMTLHILRFLETILRKRGDILTTDLCVSLLQSMNKTATSPLTGFKHCAHCISRIVLKFVSPPDCPFLSDLNCLPIKGIDLNDSLKLLKGNELFGHLEHVNNHIFKLFENNTDSRDGGFYYDALISNTSFGEFVARIWPLYYPHLRHLESEGEFCQSLSKYWIPSNVKHYKSDFYQFIKAQKIDIRLKALSLLETKRKGHFSAEFMADAVQFLKFFNTRVIGLRVISMFHNKNICPDLNEIRGVEYYLESNLENYEYSPEILKCLKLFVCQIFVVGHIDSQKSLQHDQLETFKDFLTFVYKFSSSLLIRETCELATQLLAIVWDFATCSSSELLTGYKIDRENVYETGHNLFYLHLTETGFWNDTFLNPRLIHRLCSLVKNNLIYVPHTIELVIKHYVKYFVVEDFGDLMMLWSNLNGSPISLRSSEVIKIYTDFVMAHRQITKCNNHDDIQFLVGVLNDKLNSLKTEDLFDCVLIYDILLVIVKKYDSVLMMDHLEDLVTKSMIFLGDIFDHDYHSSLDVRSTKVLEALINNTVEALTVVSDNQRWSNQFKNKCTILDQLSKVIRRSNMKRPVSLAINLLQHFGNLMDENPNDSIIKTQLFDKTLRSLYDVPGQRNVTIRRNPETRLVIHALCLNSNSLKPNLDWALEFLMGILSDPDCSDSTISSTLNCLEALISDNSIHQFTLPYIPGIIGQCVCIFNTNSWIIRNADLQLLKALIERLLGVSLSYCQRPKSIEDVFTLFPCTIKFFYDTLSHPILSDDAVIVLLFFSESRLRTNVLILESLCKIFNCFKVRLFEIITTNSNKYGSLAIKAYTSLCYDLSIPDVFTFVVNYIIFSFHKLKKNIFANLIKLLHELYQKFNSSHDKSNAFIIVTATIKLIEYLQTHDCFFFNLVSLRLFSLATATNSIQKILSLSDMTYEQRIFINNYLPFVFRTIPIDSLNTTLSSIIKSTMPPFLQIKILSILVDRFENESKFPCRTITGTLISKLTTLKDGHDKFLILSYSKTIQLLIITCDGLDSEIIDEMRRDFNTSNLYKVITYIVILGKVAELTKCDRDFLEGSLRFIVKTVMVTDCDNEMLVDLTIIFKTLYKHSLSTNNSISIVKLVFYLLLNESTSYEMSKFISHMNQAHCSSTLVSLSSLLAPDNLMRYFKNDKRVIIKLLLDFNVYVNDLPNELQSDTYYTIENSISVPKKLIQKIICKSLYGLQSKINLIN